jgi:hypothetical protein
MRSAVHILPADSERLIAVLMRGRDTQIVRFWLPSPAR